MLTKLAEPRGGGAEQPRGFKRVAVVGLFKRAQLESRRVRGLPTTQWSARTDLSLRSGWEPTAPPGTDVILAGRATSVPFTAVLNGPQRTTTDNATAAATCAARLVRR